MQWKGVNSLHSRPYVLSPIALYQAQVCCERHIHGTISYSHIDTGNPEEIPICPHSYKYIYYILGYYYAHSLHDFSSDLPAAE